MVVVVVWAYGLEVGESASLDVLEPDYGRVVGRWHALGMRGYEGYALVALVLAILLLVEVVVEICLGVL